MGTKRDRNDFINFIMDAQKNPDLTNEFLKKKKPGQLYRFFQSKGFKDIPYNDCEDILMARKRMRGHRIPRIDKIVPRDDCPQDASNY